jgi:type IV secretory pathway VirD2 relaxase
MTGRIWSSVAITSAVDSGTRAAERVTLKLGRRSEQEIRSGLEREVEAERWTSLDRSLRRVPKTRKRLLQFRLRSAH